MGRVIGNAVLVLLVGLVFGAGEVLAGDTFSVSVFLNEKNSDHQELVSTLRKGLMQGASKENRISISVNDVKKTGEMELRAMPDLVVAVGTVPTLEAINSNIDVPVLSVLIPRVSYETIIAQADARSPQQRDRNISAIYLDQPYTRRLKLIKELLPEVRNIGVVLGPSTAHYKPELQKASARLGFHLHIETIENETRLVPALEKVLKSSQVLLAVLDPLVFNRSSAQTVLLTSYRYRVPIIGLSRAYIKAGALTAVFSTPEQIGEQLSEIVVQIAEDPDRHMPPSQYPDLFSLEVNKHIAKLLGIQNIDEQSIRAKISDQAGNLK